MKAFLVLVGLIAMSQAASAGEGLNNALWCLGDTGAPKQAKAMLAKDPNGKERGTRSAAVLYAEARNAARAGQDDKALAWLRLCQWQSPGAQATIDADRAAILAHLKS